MGWWLSDELLKAKLNESEVDFQTHRNTSSSLVALPHPGDVSLCKALSPVDIESRLSLVQKTKPRVQSIAPHILI